MGHVLIFSAVNTSVYLWDILLSSYRCYILIAVTFKKFVINVESSDEQDVESNSLNAKSEVQYVSSDSSSRYDEVNSADI